MIGAIISSVIWPPGYYILRDRVPFFLTIIYLYKDKIPLKVRTTLAHYLGLCSWVVANVALYLRLSNKDMTLLSGIHWSAPSPIQWGYMITVCYLLLLRVKVEPFNALYLAFITAMGGGWFYEFIPLLFNDFNWFIFFKVNAVKVFFVEFQVLCLPIALWVVNTKMNYKMNKLLPYVGLITVMFYAFKPVVEQLVRDTLFYSYNWVIRLPAIFFLSLWIYGVKGEKNIE